MLQLSRCHLDVLGARNLPVDNQVSSSIMQIANQESTVDGDGVQREKRFGFARWARDFDIDIDECRGIYFLCVLSAAD